jgi:hypothetical protein
MDENLTKICKETNLATIFSVLLVGLILCFIVDYRIGICVAIVFLLISGKLLYTNSRPTKQYIKENYEPEERMKGSNSNALRAGYQIRENNFNNEGITEYTTRQDRRKCGNGVLPVPQPGYNPENKTYRSTNPRNIVGPEIPNPKTPYISKERWLTHGRQGEKTTDLSRYADAESTCNKHLSVDCEKHFNSFTAVPPVVVNENYVSPSNALVGGANPKTRVPAMITRPCYSLDWRDTSMVVPNMLNASTNNNLHLAGYISKDDIDTTVMEKFENGNAWRPQASTNIVENFQIDNPRGNNPQVSNAEAVIYQKKSWSNEMDMADGYNRNQFAESGFPNNLPQGNAGQSSVFKDYNRNLLTQTVQPGVFYRDNVMEPINANMGISFQQQFLPRSVTKVTNGIEIEDHDPNFAPEPKKILEKAHPNISNTYDPRFNGYGTSYRNYVDPVTGQPRFPYDDINTVKMPNYLVRSKIDTFNFADTYGSMENTGLSLNDIRSKAQDAFYQDTTSHRDDITSKLMRKTNAEMWQRRQAPITKSSRGLGGGTFGSSA